jgi:sarcosine oxidase
MTAGKQYDVAVIGAGVFGAWSAYQLAATGAKVLLVDAFGPGNSRSSSGGETRIIRSGYGPDEIYSRSARRSLELWLKLFGPTKDLYFKPSGVLWLAGASDNYCPAMLNVFSRLNIAHEQLDPDQLRHRYPQLTFNDVAYAILERDAGILMARNAVKEVVRQAEIKGVEYLNAGVLPLDQSRTIRTTTGDTINATQFIFACGPWLPKLFPTLLKGVIHVTRQDVFFFGVPAGELSFGPDRMPAWIDFNELVYGLPDIDGRGLKLAVDDHGPEFDPDNNDRIVSSEGLAAARQCLARLVPSMKDAPVLESRVCQYENTSNGDFLIDRHPEFENVWIVGGGSGHGFKHGPAVGEYVSAMVSGTGKPEPRFSLTTKEKTQARQVY